MALSLSRVVGLCYVDGQDIGKAMVRAGWAVEEKHSDGRYTADQAAAKKDKAGLWGMTTFLNPDDWRKACRGTENKDHRPAFCKINP